MSGISRSFLRDGGPPRFRPTRPPLCFPVSILRVGREEDEAAKLPPGRTRCALMLVLMGVDLVRMRLDAGQISESWLTVVGTTGAQVRPRGGVGGGVADPWCG